MISLQNISKSYDKVQALQNISMEVNDHELFGLIGPDGAGKTTLMRIIVSLLLPNTGSVTVNGIDVVKDYKKIRQIIGYMPGRFSLYTDLTVEENLRFYASVFGTTIEENYYLIEDIYKQIEPFKTRRAGKLSGGMKQKLALSCALIHKPKLLVLDEPTTGVDAVSRKEFWEMLHKLKSYGITILVSTPYMDEAMKCDRVALMQNGQILSTDAPQSIVENQGRKIWYIRSSSNTFKLINDLKAWDRTRSVYPFGQYLHFTPASDFVQESDIADYLSKQQHKQVDIHQAYSNIEDVFMDLMSQQEDFKLEVQ